jgi:hypothetical protein
LEDLSLDTIKRNLDAARAAEAAKELNETGIAAGKQHLMLLWCLFVIYQMLAAMLATSTSGVTLLELWTGLFA